MTPLSKKIKGLLILLMLIVSVGGYFFWNRLQSPGAKANSTREDQNLEELRALPYVQWSENEQSQKRGVTKHDPARSQPGYNLYTDDVRQAFLMDMKGQKVHTWNFGKKKKCEYAVLMPGAEMVGVCMGQGITKVDAKSRVLWNYRMFVHHDVEPMQDGTFYTIRRERSREYKGRLVVFDSLQRISADGKPMESWSTFEHLKKIQRLHPSTRLDVQTQETSTKKYDYYHLNSIKILPENPHGKIDPRFQSGNLLICLRNVNLVAILDRASFEIVWTYGTDTLDWPHLPVMLSNGNILIFDNGLHRKKSRVIEINPVNKQIVWIYEQESFFSGLQGSAQRLENGNTLICESMKGHVFEVTQDGKTVWEFWNPETQGKNRKTIYRFWREPQNRIPIDLLQKRQTVSVDRAESR